MSYPIYNVNAGISETFLGGPLTRSQAEYDTAMAHVAKGLTDREIGRMIGIPRGTVRDWRMGKGRATTRYLGSDAQSRCPGGHNFDTLHDETYSYLFGMYLGDGCIAAYPRGVFRLRIACDSQYQGIIEECSKAIERLMPGQKAYILKRKSRSVEISMYSKHWPCLFPQHGPGRKHRRPIEVTPWQARLISNAHESFLRGLMHSDGCRVVARDRGVMSVRYHFSNRSEDIKRLLCRSLDALEIPWTRPRDQEIAIYRKNATARLDEFIGPKY